MVLVDLSWKYDVHIGQRHIGVGEQCLRDQLWR